MATANLSSRLTMDDSDFNRKARRASDTAKNTSAKMSAGFQSAAKAFAGIFVAQVGTGAMRSTMAELDKMGKAAVPLKTTAEEVQRLSVIAAKGGTDLAVFSASLIRMRRRLGDPLNNKGAADAAEELGLNIETLLGGSPTEALEEVARAYEKHGNKANFAANMQRIFDDEWKRLIPTLSMGSQKLREMADSTKVISNEEVAKTEELNNKWVDITNTMKAAFYPVMLKVAEVVTFIADKLATVGSYINKAIEGFENWAAVAGYAYARMTVGKEEADAAMREYDADRKARGGRALGSGIELGSGGFAPSELAAAAVATAQGAAGGGSQNLSSLGMLNLKAITGGGSSVQDKILDVNKSLLERFENMQELLRQGIAPGGTM